MRNALKDKHPGENFESERCHRIASANKHLSFSDQPRSIVAKFCK